MIAIDDAWAATPLGRMARRSDPQPSHDAAKRATAFRGEHARRILEALTAGPAGQSELARRSGLTIAQVSKRLGELRRAGAIVRCGDTVSASGGREAEYAIG